MGLVALLGGAARYILGAVDPNIPVWRSVIVLLVIAMPIGIFAGIYVETLVTSDELDFLKYVAAYLAASKAKDIVLYMWEMDLQSIKDLIAKKLG